MFETWERYKDLLQRCPQHEYPNWLQIQLFYNGMSSTTKSILDIGVSGSIFFPKVQMRLVPCWKTWPRRAIIGHLRYQPQESLVYKDDKVAAVKAQMAILTNTLSKVIVLCNRQSIGSG